jgi:uncharacterized protein
MNPLDIIHQYYPPDAELTRILVRHSQQVRDMALTVAERLPHLKPDIRFIAQAAMLHDIGILETDSPKIGCHGGRPYILHGIAGREILERHGLKRHALVCERHVGAGISAEEIRRRRLPLPERDMLPVSTEEIIICYADKFFSKSDSAGPRPPESVMAGLRRYGAAQEKRFIEWHQIFSAGG